MPPTVGAEEPWVQINRQLGAYDPTCRIKITPAFKCKVKVAGGARKCVRTR